MPHVHGPRCPARRPARRTAAHARAGPGPSHAAACPECEFPPGELFTQTERAAESPRTGETRRRLRHRLLCCLVRPRAPRHAAEDRDRPELGAQLLPRERDCSDRRLPEDSRRASARHRRPSAPGADPREHSRPPQAAAADPNTPLGSCSRHPATLPARGRLPSDTTCPSERTEEKQTDFK